MEEDHVVEELDVYAFVDSGPQEHLFLLQYPTITKSSHIYHEILGACPRTSMQMKPEAKIMEIDFPLAMMNDTGNFDIAKAREFSAMPPDDRSSSSNKKQEKDHLDTLKFSSSHLPHASIQPVMGLCVDNKIILEPIKGGTLQMRPSLNHLQHRLRREIPNAQDRSINAPMKSIQMSFKKKETEEETSARLKSYAHLYKVANEEPWQEVIPASSTADAFPKHFENSLHDRPAYHSMDMESFSSEFIK